MLASAKDHHFDVFRSEHHEACREILSLAFCKSKEPVSSHISYESGAFQFFVDYYLKETSKTGMSSVCLDSQGEVLGVLCSEDLFAEVDPCFLDALERNFPNTFPQVFAVCEEAHAPFLADLQREGRAQPGSVWHAWMLAVHPAAGKRGIGKGLVEHSLSLAARQGFPYAMAECTNILSTRCFEQNGFVLRHRLTYSNFEFPKGSGQHPMNENTETGFDALDCMIYQM